MLQWFCKSYRIDLLQPNCPWQTVNLAFIEHTFINRYFYFVHLFLENSSIFSHYFFHINFWYYLDNHLFKKHHSLKTSAESFWIILGLILVVSTQRFTRMFFVLLQFLLHWNKFTASPLLEAISGYLLVCLVVFFSISWELFGFLWKYARIFLIILWWYCLLHGANF